jgi:glucokinase
MLLAGDLGATNTRLGLFRRQVPRPEEVFSRDFPTKGYPGVSPMIQELLKETQTRVEDIEAACIGAAGPVIRQRVHPTNISWYLDAQEVTSTTGLKRLHLLNDVEVMGHSVTALLPNELHVLQAGTRNPEGNAVLLTGPGLVNVLRFTAKVMGGSSVLADPTPAKVTQAALDKSDPACVEALDLFLTVYGAASGNLAMTCMATGGVYLGGGIPPRILPAFASGSFMTAFLAKEPMGDLMRSIPVSIILNDQAGLLGAAVFAAGM